MPEDRHSTLSARLAAVAPGEPPLQQICRGAVTLLTVTGAAVILMSDDEPGALTAAFGGRVAELEDLQFALGEGPCLESFRGGTPILEPDLSGGSELRWPAFTRGAAAVGARAVFVFPLRLGAIRLGVLYLFRDRAGSLSTAELVDALDLADLATVTVLELQSQAAPGDLGAGLDGDWMHHAAVHQATGVLSAQLDTTLANALSRIRAHAYANDLSIYVVAADILGGRLRLQR